MAQLKLKEPEILQGWQFSTPGELLGALEVVVAEGFTGGVKCYDNQGVKVWQMTIVVPGKKDQYVYLTPASDPSMATWLVYDGVAPKAYTQAEFEARYEIAE